MKKISIFLTAALATSWLFLPPSQAEARGERVRQLQSQARMAELDAQAARRSEAAYEEAWKRTQKAARDAYDRTQLLRSPTPVGALEYLWDRPAQRIERRPPRGYQSLPTIRPPAASDFRNLLPKR